MISQESSQQLFPFLQHKLTFNFGYRGLWAEIIITAILFLVSAFTEKSAPEKLAKTTIDYSGRIAKFEGVTDWRLHLTILAIVTVCIYLWLS